MTNPSRCCDLVMKGGITSGVVYPPAVRAIARRFHLVGIGGTSAGAIAACLAAAAEYRRRHTGSMEGFDQLEALSAEFASEGRLLALFRPDRETRRWFTALTNLLAGKKKIRSVASLAGMLFRLQKSLGKVVDNGFGLSTGMANGNRAPGETPISEWLADQIDIVAGREPNGPPLTFADLHGAPVPDALTAQLGTTPGRSIDLRCVSTCLTFGRPFEMPLEMRTFAFEESAWRRLFPARVVDYLIEESGRTRADSSLNERGKLALPDNLPVVVAARMSLSFPGLFTMVPLWARDFNHADRPLRPVWFSDGGITSNFPIHRFDSLYPAWPTLGINLQYEQVEDDGPTRSSLHDEDGNVEWIYLPKRRADGMHDLWHDFAADEKPFANLKGFAGAIFRSAQVWHDNAFLRLPGYRDRIAEVWLGKQEGGLNLNMPPETIDRLTGRGEEAGARIADRFALTPAHEPMSWEGHRWVRFRSAMAGLMEALQGFKASVDAPMTGDRPLQDLLSSVEAPCEHRFKSERQRREAEDVTRKLLELAAWVESLESCSAADHLADRPFCKGPRPRVEIGTRAPI